MRSIFVTLITLPLALCQSSSIDCKFEYNLCGWTAESPWTNSDRTFLPSPLNLSPMTLIGDGAFMTAQGHFGSNSTADLSSALSEPSQSLSMLSFKYTKTIGDANLQIMLKEGNSYRNLDTISTNMLAFWIRRTLVVPPTNEPYQIVFRVSKLRTGFDFVSIDDVMLRTAGKAVMSADEDLLRPTGLAPMSRGVEVRELRRSPTPLHPVGVTYRPPTQCSLIKCSFKANACSWAFDRWKLLNGKIVTESQADAWLSSEPVLLPMNAHFELDIFASESSEVSVYQKFGAEESLIWTQSGITLAGWNRIRLPMRFSPLPSKLLIKTSTKQGQLVAITNTNIVDEGGRDLACGGNLQVIRPRSDNVIRLTAIQSLDSTDAEASTVPTLHLVSTTTLPTPTIRPISSHLGSPIAAPIHNSLPISQPSQKIAGAFAVLPIAPTQVSSSQQPNAPRDFREARPILRPAGVGNRAPLDILSTQREASTTLPAPIVAHTKRTPSIQELISGAAGQPMLEGQLKYLAKKFGFDRMSGEQAARRFGQIQRMLVGLKQPESPTDKHPISPVNAKESNSIPPDLMSRFASLLPSSRTINGALTNKITQFISPPLDHGDDSKPFTRNNIDFVIQNAYNAYMNQARP